MSIVKMDKINVVGLSSDKEDVLTALMNLGAVEIEDVSEIKETDENNIEDVIGDNDKSQTSDSSKINEARDLLSQMKSAIELSSNFYSEKKKMFSSKRKISKNRFLEAINTQDEIIAKAEKLSLLDTKITTLKTQISKNQIICNQFEDWVGIDIELDKLFTKYTRVWPGTFPNHEELDQVKELILQDAPEAFIEVLNETESMISVAVVAWEEREERVAQILKTSKFVPLSTSDQKGTPKEIYNESLDSINKLNEQIDKIKGESILLSKQVEDFEIIHDHAMILLDKALNTERLLHTRYTFVLTGWAPSHLVESIEDSLKKKFTIAFSTRKATNEDKYPILLKNHPLIKPYEVVTDMFSTPSTKDLDPNPLMAPFFLFFFSMMLSDAGYGLLLALGCGLLVWKFKVTGNMRSISLFLFQGGLAAVIWGLMFGGFFGDMLTVISTGKFNFPTLWFNPIEDPTKLMIWSMIFGVIHILAGLGAKAMILILTGKVKNAIFDILPWYMIIIGAGTLLFGSMLNAPIAAEVGKYMALGGLGVIILFGGRGSKNPIVRLFKGVAGLYDITSYFSDILSYTRIVALSLATAVIAMVVNMLGAIAGFSVIGIIVFILAGLFGHLLNLAISALGCYVHTSRLQYVEFFSKFYEGGGRAWSPIEVKTQYTQLSKDTL